MRLLIFLVFVLFLLTTFANLTFSQSHSVVINEIAWMGTRASSSDEWIELYNATSAPIDLSGWVIYEGGGSTVIVVLGGIVDAYSYYLVERTDDNTISDIDADKFGSWGGNGLHNDNGEHLVLKDGSGNIVDEVDASGGWLAGLGSPEYKTMERVGNSWVTNDGVTKNGIDVAGNLINGTPRAANSSGAREQPQQENQQENQQQVQPSVTFSAPSNVSAGQEFAVTANLSSFEGGTYYVKVLVGKDGKFIYGNTKGTAGWLTQNASWADFPTISGSGTVQAKVDDDAAVGDYSIKVRVHKDDTNYDSEEKNITVSSAPVVAADPVGTSEDEEVEISSNTAPIEEGRVLGEEATPKRKDFKLNFYLILGLFGLLVGSGGIILAFREKLLEWRKAGSQKPESARPEPQTYPSEPRSKNRAE